MSDHSPGPGDFSRGRAGPPPSPAAAAAAAAADVDQAEQVEQLAQAELSKIGDRQIYADAYTSQYLAKNICTPFVPNLDILHDIRYTEAPQEEGGDPTVKRLTSIAIRVFGLLVRQYILLKGRKAMVKGWDGRLYVRWSTEIWQAEARCSRTSLFRAWRRLEAAGLVYRCPVRKPDPRRRDVTLTRLTQYGIDLCGLPTAAELRVAYVAGHPEIRRQWREQVTLPAIRRTVERAFRDFDLWSDSLTRWQPSLTREQMIAGYVEQLDRPPDGPGWRRWGQGADAGASLARAISQGLRQASRAARRRTRRQPARHISHAIASVLARTSRLQR